MLVKLPFNQLPEEARERLAEELCARAGNPSAISDTGRSWFYSGLVLVIVGLVGLGWRCLYGFGIPGEPSAIHGPSVAFEFLIYGSMIGVPLPWLLVRLIRRRACPFPPGRYLMPVDYIDARDPILHIAPVKEATSITVERSDSAAQIRLEFEGPSGVAVREVFSVRGGERIGPAVDGFLADQAAYEDALERGDEKRIREFDPLFSVRVSGWANLRRRAYAPQTGPRVRPIPWWTRGMVLWFPVVVALASLSLASLRDRLSDSLVFDQLLEEDSVSGWNWYLSERGARSEVVRTEHLPRAEDADHDRAFAHCSSVLTLSCWDAWLLEYQDVPRYLGTVERVRSELRPRAALEEALAAGSVAALREYQESIQAGASVSFSAEARRQISASLADARMDLLSQLADDEDLVSAFSEMMEWLEIRNETGFQIRFEPPEETAAMAVDEQVRAAYGELAPVYDDRETQVAEVPLAVLAPEFQLERVLHREQRLFSMVRGGLGAVVPEDILSLEHGPPLAPGEVVENVEMPTLVIRTSLRSVIGDEGLIQLILPREVYGDDPDFEGVYALPSVELVMDLAMFVPEQGEVWSERISVQPPVNMRALYTTMAPGGSPLDHLGSGAWMNWAYWLSAGEVRSTLFRERTHAHAGMRLVEDGIMLRAMVVALLADGDVQQGSEVPEYANERQQLSVMMERLTGLVLPEDMIDREIQWVDEHMGAGGWVDRVARGRELILQPLQEVPSQIRVAVPLCVGWASQVYQSEEDRSQGGLSDPEQLLLTNLNDALELTLDEYAREWQSLFRY